MKDLWFYYLVLVVVAVKITLVTCGIGANLTEFRTHRQRRSLIFTNGGNIKFSIGPSMPVNLFDQVSWRSMVCSYTLQGGQYTIPTEPLYPWDKWENTFARSLKQMKSKFEHYGDYEQDETREFVYTVLEQYMSRQSAYVNGRQCLLRAICENAQIHEHVGVFGQVLDIVLTPGKEDLDNSYRMALHAGRYGADCIKLYPLCPKGTSLLDQYIDEL